MAKRKAKKSHEVRCTCDGGNPNCYKCSGWGYVPNTSDAPKGVSRNSSPPKGSFKSSNYLKFSKNGKNTPCPYCGKKYVGISGVTTHVKHVHSDKWSEYTNSIYYKNFLIETKKKHCDVCGNFVENLERHIKKKHSLSSDEKTLPSNDIFDAG